MIRPRCSRICCNLLLVTAFSAGLTVLLRQRATPTATDYRSQAPNPKVHDKVEASSNSSGSLSSVPKILHQVFITERVYANYLPFINSCLSLNPDWQYYLWTDRDAERLIVDRYPEFLAKYKQYTDNLEKSDSIRYIVLHHMGGIYLDMDVECVKPFFPALENIPAFLDQERQEQTNIGLARPYSAMNSAMGSRPGHPFYRYVIDELRAATRVGDALRTTGPLALTAMLESYRRRSGAAAVRLMDPKVFSPLMTKMSEWKRKCAWVLPGAKRSSQSRRTLLQRGCILLDSKGWRSDDSDESTVCVHRFLHLGYDWIAGKQRLGPVSLTDTFPGRVNFYTADSSRKRSAGRT